MQIEVHKAAELANLLIAAVEMDCVEVAPSTAELREWSDGVAVRARETVEQPADQALRQAVRQMLRHGKFKASGRSKPAQEYLLRCAVETGRLPNINMPVDILNTVSLEVGLPISLLSLAKCSDKLAVRRGNQAESYIFNSAGQELDVTDLVVVCDQSSHGGRAVGSPIKDSMAGKIDTQDTHLVAIVYAPLGAEQELERVCQLLTDNFIQFVQGVRVARVRVG